MNSARLSRLGHKWLALIVGVQLALWTVSGFYMVVVDLDFIHGDTLVRNERPPLVLPATTARLDELRREHAQIHDVVIRALPDDGSPVYEVSTAEGIVLVDAVTGRQLSPLQESRIKALARAYYAGDGAVKQVKLLSDPATKPLELQETPLPVWRVEFDDRFATTLYLHPDTGRLVTRRHRFWRWFDFLWSLHIMDYTTRTDVNNPLLRVATALGAVTAATGLWLTFHSFAFLQRRRRPAHPASSKAKS